MKIKDTDRDGDTHRRLSPSCLLGGTFWDPLLFFQFCYCIYTNLLGNVHRWGVFVNVAQSYFNLRVLIENENIHKCPFLVLSEITWDWGHAQKLEGVWMPPSNTWDLGLSQGLVAFTNTLLFSVLLLHLHQHTGDCSQAGIVHRNRVHSWMPHSHFRWGVIFVQTQTSDLGMCHFRLVGMVIQRDVHKF